MIHLPILRGGKEYRSLDTQTLNDIATGEPIAVVSQANAGLIARDLASAPTRQRVLQERPVRELLDIAKKAARLFVDAELPCGDQGQTPEQYVTSLSATTGMPQSLCRANMKKIETVLAEMESVLGGLTRGLSLDIFDRGWVEEGERTISYRRESDSLGVVLPSNSPGVHSLWLPALVMKIPLVLKPGRQEPWTPYRIAQALLAAGCPGEALSLYPADHGGATEILLRCGASMMFGDKSTVASWADDHRVQLHGPGWSKVLFGDDRVEDWQSEVDLMVESVASNGGRSCINASGVWAPSHGREIAEALAERFAAIQARALDDPDAVLAGFSDPAMARAFSDLIDSQLTTPGAVDLTAAHRPDGRVVEVGGVTFLLPTVIWCEDPGHPLAQTELLFPFVSVVECPQKSMVEAIGSSLVVTGLTGDPVFVNELLGAKNIDRLNIGSVPTSRISWNQPHEGNLFEHLFQQRALQAIAGADAGLVPTG